MSAADRGADRTVQQVRIRSEIAPIYFFDPRDRAAKKGDTDRALYHLSHDNMCALAVPNSSEGGQMQTLGSHSLKLRKVLRGHFGKIYACSWFGFSIKTLVIECESGA